MFVKVVGTFHKPENPSSESVYTLSVSSPVDQIFQYFPASESSEVREDILEANVGDVIDVVFTNGDEELGHLTIPLTDITTKDQWTVTTSDGSNLFIGVTTIERIPKNWFDTSVELLTAPRPWYFKAEDLYNLMKYILEQYQITTSRPFVEIIHAIDYATYTVARNLLSVRLDEGFSLISKIDDLLESLLTTTDKTVDAKLLQLALSLQQLRKVVTRRLQEISFFTQEKLYLLRTQANSFDDAVRNYGNIDSAYVWAVTKTGETTELVKSDILGRIRSLRDAGRAVIASVQAQIYNRVTTHVASYQQRLYDLPVYAHPYVIGAVEATQPYINGALEKAAPLIQTIREKTPVENWIVGTKEALERNATVGPYVVAATHAIEEVKNYCTDGQYFEHSNGQEEKSGELSPAVSAH